MGTEGPSEVMTQIWCLLNFDKRRQRIDGYKFQSAFRTASEVMNVQRHFKYVSCPICSGFVSFHCTLHLPSLMPLKSNTKFKKMVWDNDFPWFSYFKPPSFFLPHPHWPHLSCGLDRASRASCLGLTWCQRDGLDSDWTFHQQWWNNWKCWRLTWLNQE